MDNNILKVALPQGDSHGVALEQILKIFSNPAMLEICTPVVYGQPQVAASYNNTLPQPVRLNMADTVANAVDGKLNIVSCGEDSAEPTPETSDTETELADETLKYAVASCMNGEADVLVVAPLSSEPQTESDDTCKNLSEYIGRLVAENTSASPINVLTHDGLRIGYSRSDVALTIETAQDRIMSFHHSLDYDFGVNAPRIAVLSIGQSDNPDVPVSEEQSALSAAVSALSSKGIICYGPYAADYLLSDDVYTHFDAVLAADEPQAQGFLRALHEEGGVCLVSGMPIVCTIPLQDMQDEQTGQTMASEEELRQAIYLGIDVKRNHVREDFAKANPLRRQYYDKHDDSDSLKHMAAPEDDEN